MALQTPRPPQVPRSLTDVLKVAIKEEVVEEVAEVAIKEENVEEVEEVTEVAINEEEVEEAETEASVADSGWGTAAAPGPERMKAWRERAQRVMKSAWAEMEKEWSSAPCEPCDHSSLLPGVDWCAQCGCPPWAMGLADPSAADPYTVAFRSCSDWRSRQPHSRLWRLGRDEL